MNDSLNDSLNAEIIHTKDDCVADDLLLSSAYGLICGNCNAHDELSTTPTEFDDSAPDYDLDPDDYQPDSLTASILNGDEQE